MDQSTRNTLSHFREQEQEQLLRSMIWLYFGEQQGHYLQKMSLRMDHVLDLPKPPKHTLSSPTVPAAGTAEAGGILAGLCQHIGGLFRTNHTISQSFKSLFQLG